MLRCKYVKILLSICVLGCSSPTIDEDINVKEDSPVEGVVSENPPGADDWHTGDTNALEEMKSSYPNCSNQVPMWSEPDPLANPCNFQLLNQNGDLIELYDFEGDVIVLDFSTTWCRVCKTVAEHVQSLQDSYLSLTIITILTENNSGDEPTVEELSQWSSEYGITTSNVLAGNNEIIGTQNDQWNVNGIPCFFLIDKNFYVRKIQPGWNEETMIENIESLLQE